MKWKSLINKIMLRFGWVSSRKYFDLVERSNGLTAAYNKHREQIKDLQNGLNKSKLENKDLCYTLETLQLMRAGIRVPVGNQERVLYVEMLINPHLANDKFWRGAEVFLARKLVVSLHEACKGYRDEFWSLKRDQFTQEQDMNMINTEEINT